MGRGRDRLAPALLLSLLIHALLLSLTFGGQGLGLPDFGFFWRDRRIEVPDVTVVLVPAHVAATEPATTALAELSQQPSIEQAAQSEPAVTPSMPPAPPMGGKTAARISGEGKSKRNVASRAASVKTPTRAEGSDHVAPAQIPEQADVGVAPSETRPAPMPADPSVPTPVIASDSSPETVAPPLRDAGEVVEEAARAAAAQQEAERQEAARREEAARQEAARQEEAARVEAVRREAEREEAARAASARQEAEREEAARTAAARQEAERQDAARREEAARVEAARREEAARVEAARALAEQQEAARLAAARQEAARALAEQQEDAAREERRRAIGRQLDEEAARRDESSADRPRSTLPLSLSTARRVRLWGRADRNAELIRYAEAWERRIQLSTPVETVREVAKRLQTNPMVTVAIRSDGSVESVVFVLSSGVAEIDQAIRRIVQSHEHYEAFPPALAREFDVIEIRRTWYFDTAVRFY